MEPRRMLFSALAAALVLIAAPACDDDGTSPLLTDFETIWPTDEGRSWTFAAERLTWEPDLTDSIYVFPSYDQVPRLPGWSEIIDYLDHLPPPVDPDTVHYALGLRFDGSITTPPGITARNLQETLDGVDVEACGSAAPGQPRVLRALAVSRQFTKERLRQLLEPSQPVTFGPLLIHGGAFEKNEDWIGTYGCMDSLLAWKFLESPLYAGATFSHSIAPVLADDVILHVRVRRNTTVTTLEGEMSVVEVTYALDYGVLQVTDTGSPEPFGSVRVALLGRVFYAPNVGPVGGYERDLVPIGTDGFGSGVSSTTLALTGTQPGPGT